MVACAPLSSKHLPSDLAVPMISSARVEDLKTKLLAAAENGNEDSCADTLDELRKAVTTREILEETRVGFHVNNVRKEYLKKWPNLQKKCRELIKGWQDFVNAEIARATPSAGSSANCTPGLISPSVARLRKVTPNTPYNKRITSTGLVNGHAGSRTVSPANGSYAPKTAVASPSNLVNGMHKSFSAAADLSTIKEETPVRNGKRKNDEPADATTVSKKSKTLSSRVSPTAPQTPGSVLAARRNAQSTSELVAQLSQNLPDHMNIDSTIREHEERVKREQHDEEMALQISMAALNQPERKKRKYERKQKPVVVHEPVKAEERRGDLVMRFPRFQPASEPSKVTEVPDQQRVPPVEEEERATTSEPKGIQKDWMDILPSLDELRIRSEAKADYRQKKFGKIAELTKKDPTKVRHINSDKRMIFMLPYLDNPRGPDFIKYRYPRGSQYYAEQNFLYGAPRPKD